jgi:hypothetical protein
MSLEEVIQVVMSMEVDLKAIKERSGAVILESQATLTHFRWHADDLVSRMTILERKMLVMESSEDQVIQDMRHQIQGMMSTLKVMNEEVEALKKMRADVETMKDMRGDVETLKAMRAEVDATKAQQELMKEELKTLMTSSSEGAPSSKKAKKS